MPQTHINPPRPNSYFDPEHVDVLGRDAIVVILSSDSDNSEPDTDVVRLDANSSPASLTSSECSSEDSDPADVTVDAATLPVVKEKAEEMPKSPRGGRNGDKRGWTRQHSIPSR